jgi:hypothetical protein
MLELLFTILMFVVFGKILWFALRATWGITKILFSVVILPFVLVFLVLQGLIFIALPVLAIIGLISLFALHD